MVACATWLVGAFVSASLPLFAGSSRRALQSGEFVLESLPVSPFVEKVRWALDKLGVEYAEEQDYGVLMFLRGRSVPTLHYKRKGQWAEASMTNSADILCYLAGRYAHTERGAFLARSARADELEAKIDVAMEHMRRLFYFHVMQADDGALAHMAPRLWGALEPHVPRWQKVGAVCNVWLRMHVRLRRI